MSHTRSLTTDEVHAIACRAFAGHPEVRSLLSQHGDALYSSLFPPDGESDCWRELVLLGDEKAEHVDDLRGTSQLLATCFVHPMTGAVEIIIEENR